MDEVQDFSPLELQLLLNMTPENRRSVTLAGDRDQRIRVGPHLESWDHAFEYLNVDITKLEPLKVGYRSTYEIMELAKKVMGAYSTNIEWQAVRHGAAVGIFSFQTKGQMLGRLAETLSELMLRESQASVAVLSRYASQADTVYEGLFRSDIPQLRRVRDQDFSFTSGIDVTEIAQVKGLEFDYVILTDVDSLTFGDDEKTRHLLYVGITRAAHQLWILHTGQLSPLIPPDFLPSPH